MNLLLESGNSTDLYNCLHTSTESLFLHNASLQSQKLTAGNKLGCCSSLTELTFQILEVDSAAVNNLSTAAREGNLPVLSKISFEGCWQSMTGKLSDLLQSTYPSLTHLNLSWCFLNRNDIETLTRCLSPAVNKTLPALISLCLHVSKAGATETDTGVCSAWKKFFQNGLTTVETLDLQELSKDDYRSITKAINDRKLEHLLKLSIAMKQTQIIKFVAGRGIMSGKLWTKLHWCHASRLSYRWRRRYGIKLLPIRHSFRCRHNNGIKKLNTIDSPAAFTFDSGMVCMFTG